MHAGLHHDTNHAAEMKPLVLAFAITLLVEIPDVGLIPQFFALPNTSALAFVIALLRTACRGDLNPRTNHAAGFSAAAGLTRREDCGHLAVPGQGHDGAAVRGLPGIGRASRRKEIS